MKPAPKQKSARAQHPADSRFGFAQPVFQPQTAALPTVPVIQAKLKVGEPDDKFEEEADQVAELTENGNGSILPSAAAQSRSPVGNLQRLYGNQAVLQMRHGSGGPPAPSVPLRPSQSGILQRKCACGQNTSGDAEGEECRAKNSPMQQSAHGSPGASAPSQPMPRSGGAPIPGELRADMEGKFGTSFADVRVHSDSAAGDAARRLGARAFTKGSDLYFAPGHYQLGSGGGLRLLAHELTHVMQQRNGRFPIASSDPHVAAARSRLEDEAVRAERTVTVSDQPVQVREQATEDAIHQSLDWSDVFDAVVGRFVPGGPAVVGALRKQVEQDIEELADRIVARLGTSAGPKILELNQLRGQARQVQSLRFSPEALAVLEWVYYFFRSLVPWWVPIPDIRLLARRSSRQDPLSLRFRLILLFLAFLLVAWFPSAIWIRRLVNGGRGLSRALSIGSRKLSHMARRSPSRWRRRHRLQLRSQT